MDIAVRKKLNDVVETLKETKVCHTQYN